MSFQNALQNKRVIVIDDDHDVVDIFSEYLSLYGAKIVGVGYDGKQAVDLYKTKHPDIVFLDVSMPIFDGFYALEEIKKLDLDSKIILVTGDLTKDTELRAVKLDASAIIYKPFKMDKVLQVIGNLGNGLIIQSF